MAVKLIDELQKEIKAASEAVGKLRSYVIKW